MSLQPVTDADYQDKVMNADGAVLVKFTGTA